MEKLLYSFPKEVIDRLRLAAHDPFYLHVKRYFANTGDDYIFFIELVAK